MNTPQLNGARRHASPPMKFPPLDTSKRITNKQLAEQNQRLHNCLHSVGEQVEKLARTVRDDRHTSNNRDQVMDVRIARIEGALGVKLPSAAAMEAGEAPKPVGRKLAGITPWKALWTVVGAMTGVQLLYQILGPPLLQFILDVNQRLLGG